MSGKMVSGNEEAGQWVLWKLISGKRNRLVRGVKAGQCEVEVKSAGSSETGNRSLEKKMWRPISGECGGWSPGSAKASRKEVWRLVSEN